MSQLQFHPTNKSNFSLKDAGRDYSSLELEAEEKAVTFSVSIYKRIKPLPGTLAFLLRNIKENGGNDSVIEFLRFARQTNKSKFIDTFIRLWNKMDEYSQNRPDIFDWLCRKYDIPLAKFWGTVQEGMFPYNDILTQSSLSGYKPEFIELVKRMAQKDKNFQDRKLLSDAMKLTETKPLIQLTDNSTHQTANVVVENGQRLPSFLDSTKKADNEVGRNNKKYEPKALPASTQEYINTEIVNEPEKELVSSKLSDEDEFHKIAKELF